MRPTFICFDELTTYLTNMETWKPIPGWPMYEVSDHGNVRRPNYRSGQTLKPDSNFGYMRVALWKNDKRKHYRIHNLVMLAFVGECPKGLEVNHIDGNRANNRLTNLEYLTHQENVDHARKVLGQYRGERNAIAKLNNDAVQEIRARRAAGEERKDIAARFNITPGTVTDVCNRKTWAHV